MTSADDVDEPDGLLAAARLDSHSSVCVCLLAPLPYTHTYSLHSTTCADLQIVNRLIALPSDRLPLPSRPRRVPPLCSRP